MSLTVASPLSTDCPALDPLRRTMLLLFYIQQIIVLVTIKTLSDLQRKTKISTQPFTALKKVRKECTQNREINTATTCSDSFLLRNKIGSSVLVDFRRTDGIFHIYTLKTLI